MFFSKLAEVCPKKYPIYRKAVQVVNSDVLRSLVTIEKYLDRKFLKKGFKEISGFEWNISDIRRLQETLESWFSNSIKEYNGVKSDFLKKLNYLRGMIELHERKNVQGLTRVENWAAVSTFINHMDKKIKSDKKFVKSVKNSGGGFNAGINWERDQNKNYSWNLLLLSGTQERLLSMLNLLQIAKAHCFKEKFLGKRNIVQECESMPDYPSPGSSLIFELNRKGTEYFIRMLYNGVEYRICGASKYCKYSDFRKMMLLKVHLPNGIFRECLNQRRSMEIVHTH